MAGFKYRDFKQKKHYRTKSTGINCRYVDMDLKYSSAVPVLKYNKNIWNMGIDWFNDGFKLEEADEKIRNNTNFINGYNHAKRLKMINDELEILGAMWFEKGELLENAEERYTNNQAFVKGYNDAKNNVKRKGL